MAQFPIAIDDQEGLVDAVNNLLSGPSGLGQNFAGFSSYTPAWLTGNFRVPYTQNTLADLYVAPIPLSQSEMLDGRTWKFTFATEQAVPPFANGNGIEVAGSENSFYNDVYGTIGVTECTTTYVIARTSTSYAVVAPSPGGEVFLVTGTSAISTDANARVTVTGGTDRVFISAQIDNTIEYAVTTAPATLTYTVEINRYYGFPNNDPTNPDFVFNYSGTVAQKIYNFTQLTGSGTVPQQETIFTALLDQPAIGFYWYILELSFEFTSGTGQVITSEFGLRSLSAQVVKQ
jgi:hypothetical protein